VLGVGFRHPFTRAFIVTLYDVGSEDFNDPGSLFGTITKRLRHLGLSHRETTGVLLTKCSRTF
jgi:hypothetical protein